MRSRDQLLGLVLEGVGKSYGATEVLVDVDVEVLPGEVLALLGPSGCGKSTLLRVAAGFEQPDRGRVLLGGEPVTAPGPARGMVAQSGSLLPWLSVRDNLAFGPRAAGRRDAEQVAERLIAQTGLDGFAEALPRDLSGGMRQRAAIAQVLANRPPVLLLDEPFGALDAQTRLRMQEWLRGLLRDRPTTVLLVTHDVDEALLLGDRLLLLGPRPTSVVDEVQVVVDGPRDRGALTRGDFVALKASVLARVLGD
jgi:NitT/TauT family transport system ATP-binding protein